MRQVINEKLPISEYNPIRARAIDYDHFTYPWHFHGEYEIVYIQESRGHAFVGSAVEPFWEGHLFLFGPNLPHCLQSDPAYWKGDPTLRVKGVIIQFETDFMNHSVANYPQFFPIKNLLEASRMGLSFPTNPGDSLTKLVEQMPSTRGMGQVIKLLTLLQKMAEHEGRITLSSPTFQGILPLATDGKIEKITSYLCNAYTRSISLDEIASFASMNPTAFCRYFKEHTGKTFKQYLIDLRVGYACKLLSAGTLNVSQIALESGFETVAHFNRLFRRLMGLTPTEYRRQVSK